MPKRVITPLTGGLDSTYNLWDELANTDHEVTAWNINNDLKFLRESGYNRMSGDNAVREITVNNIVSWLKTNVRDFNFEYITVDLTDKEIHNVEDPTKFIPTSLPIMRLAIKKINNNEADCFIDTKEHDNYTPYYRRGNNKDYVIGTKQMELDFKERATRGELSFKLIDNKYTQATAIHLLPEELYNLTRSCDEITSYDDVGCGKCWKCKKRKKYQIFLKTFDNDLQKIYDYYYSLCSQPNNKWILFRELFEKTDPPLQDPPDHGSSVVIGE